MLVVPRPDSRPPPCVQTFQSGLEAYRAQQYQVAYNLLSITLAQDPANVQVG